jgi:hypothetical protein
VGQGRAFPLQLSAFFARSNHSRSHVLVATVALEFDPIDNHSMRLRLVGSHYQGGRLLCLKIL